MFINIAMVINIAIHFILNESAIMQIYVYYMWQKRQMINNSPKKITFQWLEKFKMIILKRRILFLILRSLSGNSLARRVCRTHLFLLCAKFPNFDIVVISTFEVKILGELFHIFIYCRYVSLFVYIFCWIVVSFPWVYRFI